MAFLTLNPVTRLMPMPNASPTMNAAISARNSQRMAWVLRRDVRTSRGGGPARPAGLVRFFVAQDAHRRQRQNLQIQQRRPAAQVFEVVVHTRLHVFHA